jgi:hypothetical protein
MVSWPSLELVQLGSHWGDFEGYFIALLLLPILIFAAAIFVNNSLKIWCASSVLPSCETIPFNALVTPDAPFMTSVSGVT